MSKEIIRICAISDTHNFHHSIDLPREADIIIHAGDYTELGRMAEVNNFLNWYSSLDQFEHKLLINGNHELDFEKNYSLFKGLIPKNIIFLDNNEVIIEGLKFYGSPMTKEFFNWAFMYKTDEQAENIWSNIPNDTDILITHQPAYAIRDYTEKISKDEIDHNVGCKILGKHIDRLDNLLLHISGHVHHKNNYGASKIGNTMFANAVLTEMTNSYQIGKRKPLLFEIDKNTREIEEIKYEIYNS